VKRYRLTAEAGRDLDEVIDYLLVDSVDAALRVRTKLESSFDRIARMPGIGHRREDLTKEDLRFFAVFHWLVVYRPTRPVEIIAVVHGARDVPRVLRRRR